MYMNGSQEQVSVGEATVLESEGSADRGAQGARK